MFKSTSQLDYTSLSFQNQLSQGYCYMHWNTLMKTQKQKKYLIINTVRLNNFKRKLIIHIIDPILNMIEFLYNADKTNGLLCKIDFSLSVFLIRNVCIQMFYDDDIKKICDFSLENQTEDLREVSLYTRIPHNKEDNRIRLPSFYKLKMNNLIQALRH